MAGSNESQAQPAATSGGKSFTIPFSPQIAGALLVGLLGGGSGANLLGSNSKAIEDLSVAQSKEIEGLKAAQSKEIEGLKAAQQQASEEQKKAQGEANKALIEIQADLKVSVAQTASRDQRIEANEREIRDHVQRGAHPLAEQQISRLKEITDRLQTKSDRQGTDQDPLWPELQRIKARLETLERKVDKGK